MAAAKKRSSARRPQCGLCGMRTGPIARSAHPGLCVECYIEVRQRENLTSYREAAMWVLREDKAGKTTPKKTKKKVVAKKKPKAKPKPKGPVTRFDREEVI